MTEFVEKVFALVVRETATDGTAGHDVLVFEHPETPPQLPKGGRDPGETPLAGALRELREETGLTDVRVLRELPSMRVEDPYVRARSVERQHWHLWLVTPARPLPDEWAHCVTGDGLDAGMTYRCFWLPLDADAPTGVHPLFRPLVTRLRDRWLDRGLPASGVGDDAADPDSSP